MRVQAPDDFLNLGKYSIIHLIEQAAVEEVDAQPAAPGGPPPQLAGVDAASLEATILSTVRSDGNIQHMYP